MDPFAQSGGRLVVVGLSHRTAPVELREHLALQPEQWHTGAGQSLSTVLLVTCNRVEVYAWETGRSRGMVTRLARALASAAGLPRQALEPHLFAYRGTAALEHLVRVVAGLDSLVVGEDQIRGQLRDAYRLAVERGVLSSILKGVLSRALEAGRRVRGATLLGSHPGIAAAAVQAAGHLRELQPTGLRGRSALVFGAGEMASSAARTLLSHGARVTIVNRTPEHAHSLATQLGSGVLTDRLEALPQLLLGVDLVVGATAARRPVLDAAMVRAALAGRAGRPLVILDIGLPRNVDPRVRGVSGVRLVDLDELEQLCPVDRSTWQAEVARAEALAADEARAIARWLRVRAMSPAISELREYGEEIRAGELQRAAPRLRGISPDQRATVEAMTRAIVNKLLHGPTLVLRDAAARHPSRVGRSRALVHDVLGLERSRNRPRAAAPGESLPGPVASRTTRVAHGR